MKARGYAMFLLTSSINLSQIILLENCNLSKKIMDKLVSIYEQKSETNKMILHETFYTYKMDPKNSMSNHISNVENLLRQVREIGDNVSNVAVVTKILSGLPPKYEHLRQA